MSLVRTGREAIRYMGGKKQLVNPNPAIKLIAEQPTIEAKSRVVYCTGGNEKLGHPRVYINLDHGVKSCGYCGQTYHHTKDHAHH